MVCDIPVPWPEGTREPDSHEEVYAYKTTDAKWREILGAQQIASRCSFGHKKTHQEGLTDPQNESDGKIFERPGSLRSPFRIVDKISESPESKLQQLIPTATNKRQEIQSRRRQHLVLRFAAGAQLARANDTQDDNTSWSRSLFNQPLSASHDYHCIEFTHARQLCR